MSLKIVLTDAATVCANDIDLSTLNEFGEVVIYEETSPLQTAERIKDADIIIINKTLITKQELDAAENLKLIALFATGYNNVDIKYARERGVTVCNAGTYSTNSVAQQVFAYILGHASKVGPYDADVKNGDWIRSRLFCFFSRPTEELAGKTLGILGYGAIGKKTAKIASAFDMRVIAHTRTPSEDGIAQMVDFETLLAESDYLSVHCPLTEQTSRLFDKNTFAKMKKGAFFINTARGGIIDEYALRDALACGHLSGAAIDVLTTEPMQSDCPLLTAPNITITPHIAWAAIETRLRLLSIVKNNIRAFLEGKPVNVVN